MAKLSRPVVRWFGGKWKLAPWIIAHFPPHRVYVEPFGGGGSVLLRKERSYAEVYNDLDGEIVNLFKVLRDQERGERLAELLRLTPFARDEFLSCREPGEPDEIERARRLVVYAFQGFGTNAHSRVPTGFRSNSNRSGTTPAQDWRNYPVALGATIDRLRGVVIENRDAKIIMAQHDGPKTLHYCDPPYVHSTRSQGNPYDLAYRGYAHELSDDDHRELLTFLRGLQGMVVLSGYPHPLYDAALPEWRRIEKAAHADGARDRTEVLWINRAAAEAMHWAGPLYANEALDAGEASAGRPASGRVGEPKPPKYNPSHQPERA